MILKTPAAEETEEVEQFLADPRGADGADEPLRAHAPWLDRRLRALAGERSAIVCAIVEARNGGRALASTLLARIRTLVKDDDRLVMDCYWQDVGGEGAR